MTAGDFPWTRPLGARVVGSGTEFRVWAPNAEEVAVLGDGGEALPLQEAGHGIWQGLVPGWGAGADYRYRLTGVSGKDTGGQDPSGTGLPDPASRWQPDGIRGPSRVYEPRPVAPLVARPLCEHVIYELHVGTFSPEGTFEGAIPWLAGLRELGVTAVEIMPVAEFPGSRGWGYDGVFISAAQSSYGGPAALQSFVEAAHSCGLAVILDVVYNHVGASGGGALAAYGPYFTSKYETPWGQAINYDDAGCDPVREWVLQSAEGWVRDFGIDGLRLDAIHAIFDSSPEHIVAAIARRVHAVRPGALVIAESGLNDPRVMRAPEVGGYGCDAAWADDFHHSLRTLVTDERDGYYEEFGRVSQLAKCFGRPHVHDGTWSSFRRRRFGAPADDVPAERFVVFSQDHDQVGNRAFGDRMPAAARPLAAFVTLLAPFVPMLFMGEEYGEDAPFQFFTDHIDPDIAEATRNGRREEFASFESFTGSPEDVPDPQAVETFERSKLTRRPGDPAVERLYRELLAVRRELPAGDVDAVSFDEEVRWLRVRRGSFELVCNFGAETLGLGVERSRLRVATHDDVGLEGGRLELPSLSGALLGP